MAIDLATQAASGTASASFINDMAVAVEGHDAWIEAAELAVASYTPTWSAATSGTPTVGTGGSAAYAGYWRVLANELEGYIGLTYGTTGISGGVGAWSWTIPAGLSMWRPGGVLNNRVIGTWYAVDASPGVAYQGTVVVQSATTIQLRHNHSTVTVGSVTVPFTWAINDNLLISYKVRID